MMNHTQPQSYTTLDPAVLTPGEALQQLYSQTESTGPNVGSVLLDFEENRADTTRFIEQIKANGDAFRAPQDGTETHFTDIIGEAREAADNTESKIAVNLLDEVIIELLEETVELFQSIEEECMEVPGVSDSTVEKIAYVRVSYEHMLDLATTARKRLNQNA